MRTWLRLVSMVMALAIIAAACSDDDGEKATTDGTTDGAAAACGGTVKGTTPEDALAAHKVTQKCVDELLDPPKPVSGNTTRGVTDDTITIKGVTALKQADGIEPFPGMCEGTKARVERANRDQELSRTIEFLGCADDVTNRENSLRLMQEAVEQDEVFAVLPVTSQGFFSEKYLNDNHVPYFGYGFMPGYCGYENVFAFAVGGTVSCDKVSVATTILLESYADATGKDPKTLKVAGISEDAPAGINGIKVVQAGVERAGGDMVFAEHSVPPPTAPAVTDWTPYAEAILAKQPNLVMIVTSTSPVAPLAEKLKESGFDGDIMNFVYSDYRIFLSPTLPTQLDKAYTVSPVLGASQYGGDAFEQIADDLKAADVTKFGQIPVDVSATTLTAGVIWGYAAADFFIEALKKTKEPLTTEALANTINKGFDAPGLGNAWCPSHWPVGHVAATPCGSAIQIDGPGKKYDPKVDLRAFTQVVLGKA